MYECCRDRIRIWKIVRLPYRPSLHPSLSQANSAAAGVLALRFRRIGKNAFNFSLVSMNVRCALSKPLIKFSSQWPFLIRSESVSREERKGFFSQDLLATALSIATPLSRVETDSGRLSSVEVVLDLLDCCALPKAPQKNLDKKCGSNPAVAEVVVGFGCATNVGASSAVAGASIFMSEEDALVEDLSPAQFVNESRIA